jgi:hypothetical protein
MLFSTGPTELARETISRVAWLLKGHLSVSGAVALIVVFCLAWLTAAFIGQRVSGVVLVTWLLVPLFLIAAGVCIGGPGHWFAKSTFEGPTVFTIARKDGITALDLVGATFMLLSLLSASLAVALRWRHVRMG